MMLYSIPMLTGSGRRPLLVEIPDDIPVDARTRVAVETAVRRGESLANLNLYGVNLRAADLSRADMRGTIMCRANLSAADLSDADLSGTDLYRADMRGADLANCNLSGADLHRCDMSNADLYGCTFSPPEHPSWSTIRDDLARVLDQARPEVPALLAALREGRVDGGVYHGECACLCGTIANLRGVVALRLGFQNPDSAIETLFFSITKGDTPETNPIAKIVEAWIVTYQQEHGL